MNSRCAQFARLGALGLCALLTFWFVIPKSRAKVPPEPDWRNKNHDEVDDLLNIAVRDSMAASDPPSMATPNVDLKR